MQENSGAKYQLFSNASPGRAFFGLPLFLDGFSSSAVTCAGYSSRPFLHMMKAACLHGSVLFSGAEILDLLQRRSSAIFTLNNKLKLVNDDNFEPATSRGSAPVLCSAGVEHGCRP